MRSLIAALVACAAAAAAPLVSPRTPSEPGALPEWPQRFEGRPLAPLPLGERDAAFARGFPGRVARFQDGERQLVLRQVTRATRRLHPAADCFRGSGHDVRPLPMRRAAGRDWGCFAASRGVERLRVCERIEDAAGRTWSDTSSWYWSALFDDGPWLAVTTVEPDPSAGADRVRP